MLEWLRRTLTGPTPVPVSAAPAQESGPVNHSSVELAQLTRQIERQLMEDLSTLYDSVVDPREPLYDDPSFVGGDKSAMLQPRPGRGEYLPAYRTLTELQKIQSRSRVICTDNEFAKNGLGNRVAYTVGTGLQYEPVRVKPTGAPAGQLDPLCTAVSDVLDEFIDLNDWPELEQEIVRRGDEDGEAFLWFFDGDNGVEVRVIEPEFIQEFDSTTENSFGVITAPGDLGRVLGYWVQTNPERPELEFVHVRDMLHIKRNTSRNAKRGLPTFWPIWDNLDRAEKALRNMSTLVRVQATYAVLRKHKGRSASQIQSFRDALADATKTDPNTGKTKYVQQLPPGSILDMDDYTDYEFPGMNVNAAAAVAIIDAELRACAAGAGMPEYMFTANASNANFASTQVAESPGVKGFECLGSFYQDKFGRGRYRRGQCQPVMWRVIKRAVDVGRLPPEVLTEVKLQVTGPTIAARNRKEETDRNAVLSEKGVLSRRSWAKREDLDYEAEQANIKTEPKNEPPKPNQPGPSQGGTNPTDGSPGSDQSAG